MAKKTVASLRVAGAGKNLAKVVRVVKSPKTGAYTFKEDIIPSEEVKAYFAKNK